MDLKIAFLVQQPFFKSIIGVRFLSKLVAFDHSSSVCEIGVFCDLAKPHIQLASAVKLINGSKCLEKCLLCYFLGSMLIACQ